MFRFPYQSLCLSICVHVWVRSPSGLSPGLSPWLTSFPALISMVRRRVSSWPALGRSNQNFTGCARETRGIANKTPAAKSASSCATPSSESTRFHLAITSSPHGEASPMELSHDVDTCLSIHQWVINRSHRQGSQLKASWKKKQGSCSQHKRYSQACRGCMSDRVLYFAVTQRDIRMVQSADVWEMKEREAVSLMNYIWLATLNSTACQNIITQHCVTARITEEAEGEKEMKMGEWRLISHSLHREQFK